MITWRDDDILWQQHGLDELLLVDDMLRAAGARHTVAIIADTLTPHVATVLRDRQMSCQLHCWQHDDLSVQTAALAQLPDAVNKIADLIGTPPTVLYPPWNRSSPVLEAVAAALGLTVSYKKFSLEQFIRFKGQLPDPQPTINFHYWHEPDRAALRTALALVQRPVSA